MNLDPETRLSLIAKLGGSDNEDAWGEFVTIYQPVIQRFLARYNLQYADVAEVTQEVLAGVVKSIDEWNGSRDSNSFRGWLYRITRNKAVDMIRTRVRKSEVRLSSASNLACEATIESEVANSEFQVDFEQQIFLWAAEKVKPTVKPVNWQCFWQSTIKEQSIEQVAKELNVDSSTVYVARCRIMKRLTQIVEKKLDESYQG